MTVADTQRPTEPGACGDPSCPVLHADPAHPIHPPDYIPGGPLWPSDEAGYPQTDKTTDNAQEGNHEP